MPSCKLYDTVGRFYSFYYLAMHLAQGDHLSGKPGNVREFETCQGMSGKKSCQGSVPKLFITS